MKMSKVGNQTNSQDPQAVNSRVFVGNLNTFQCSKTDVERMFQRYGRLAGISMHKGYAFVQFTNPFDARSACLGEDGRTVLSQILVAPQMSAESWQTLEDIIPAFPIFPLQPGERLA
ncbi:RNA-binding protein Raly [Ooceraea biroi]|uniref:RNA-binding protein Raly n=1 Tax=Ooceraea biroi TaxID=2015173 RepID=A0A026W063_OOCBI|nr:RNA-binding protein Raly [Ooceraea biroi]